jgi:hypothetical protein
MLRSLSFQKSHQFKTKFQHIEPPPLQITWGLTNERGRFPRCKIPITAPYPLSSSLSMRRLTHANERESFSYPLHPISMGHLFSLFPSPVVTLPHILRLFHRAHIRI